MYLMNLMELHCILSFRRIFLKVSHLLKSLTQHADYLRIQLLYLKQEKMRELIIEISVLSMLILASSAAQFNIISSPFIQGGQRIPLPVCFADCSSCQQSDADCETCFEPWFQIEGGECQISGLSSGSPKYILESTNEEQRSTDFIPSTAWISNSTTLSAVQCAANPIFDKNFSIAGFLSDQPLNYRRTISQHNYIGMKFLLLLFNWNEESSLNITVTNEDNRILVQQMLLGTHPRVKFADQNATCQGKNYKKISVSLEMFEEGSRQFLMEIVPQIQVGNNSQTPEWSFSSFVLVSGKCNESCETCKGFSPEAKFCDICTNFRNHSASERCSTCVNGFQTATDDNGNEIGCQKCKIQYQLCEGNASSQVCQFSNYTNVSQNCSFRNNPEIKDEVNAPSASQMTFFSSLFQVVGFGSRISQCGWYSYVGPAQFGQIISRTFLTLPAHIGLSINFNVFVIDQISSEERYNVIILIDGESFPFDIDLQNMKIPAFSNQCGDREKPEGMKTFETTQFIPHIKVDNVDIGISLGSQRRGQWGLRDIRLVYRQCDNMCEDCRESGCEQCKGLLQLVDGECKGCPGGTGYNNKSEEFCSPCFQNCLTCKIHENEEENKCVECYEGYYIYEFNGRQTCDKIPNFGSQITKKNTLAGEILESNCTEIEGKQAAKSFINNENNTNEVITAPSYRIYSFQVAEDKLINQYSLPEHYKYKVQFFLMRIDNWNGDYIDIYINDLRVKRIQYFSRGNKLCEDSEENEQISFEQFILTDDNKTVTVEYEVVHQDPLNKTARKFGVGEFKIFPIGCKDCSNYNFFYRIQYTTDFYLNVQVAFNMIYVNTNPDEFKNIFRLKIGDEEIPYEIDRNDSIRYWLKASLPKDKDDLIEENITLFCKYPYKVTADIQRAENKDEVFFTERYLMEDNGEMQQVGQSNDAKYNQLKGLDSDSGSIKVLRYIPLGSYEDGIRGLRTFFEVVTRIVVYLGFASFIIGCQTPFTHLMHNFQKIWVHIYVASLTINSILKSALIGFRECQDQNIAINPVQWEVGLPDPLFYDAPAQYQQYYHDINFWRNIYNVGVAFLILTIIYLIGFFVFRNKQLIRRDNDQSFGSIFLRHLKITFNLRPAFYFNSLIFYQFFTVMLACCLQFIDLYPNISGLTGFKVVTTIACITAFVFATLYPILFHTYLRYKRGQSYDIIRGIKNAHNQYNNDLLLKQAEQLKYSNTIFNNRYAEIFYRFLPNNIWNSDLSTIDLIKETEIFYNIIRFGELWWYAIVVCLLYSAPFAQAFLLIITNLCHILLFIVFDLNTTKTFKFLKGFELLGFMGLEIIILVMYALSDTLRPESFQTLGVVGVIVIFFIIVLSIFRTGYTFIRIWREYRYPGELDDHIPVVIRFPVGFQRDWLNNDFDSPKNE